MLYKLPVTFYVGIDYFLIGTALSRCQILFLNGPVRMINIDLGACSHLGVYLSSFLLPHHRPNLSVPHFLHLEDGVMIILPSSWLLKHQVSSIILRPMPNLKLTTVNFGTCSYHSQYNYCYCNYFLSPLLFSFIIKIACGSFHCFLNLFPT